MAKLCLPYGVFVCAAEDWLETEIFRILHVWADGEQYRQEHFLASLSLLKWPNRKTNKLPYSLQKNCPSAPFVTANLCQRISITTPQGRI